MHVSTRVCTQECKRQRDTKMSSVQDLGHSCRSCHFDHSSTKIHNGRIVPWTPGLVEAMALNVWLADILPCAVFVVGKKNSLKAVFIFYFLWCTRWQKDNFAESGIWEVAKWILVKHWTNETGYGAFLLSSLLGCVICWQRVTVL